MTGEIHILKATPIVPYAPDPLFEFALFLSPFVVPVSGLIAGVKWADWREPTSTAPSQKLPAAGAAAAQEAGAAIAGWPSGAILTIQTHDHYLEVRTGQGAKLLRGRMLDALESVRHAPGLRPHRSWWVSLGEIDRFERRDRDLVLRLTSGQCIPVARSRQAEVRRIFSEYAGGR